MSALTPDDAALTAAKAQLRDEARRRRDAIPTDTRAAAAIAVRNIGLGFARPAPSAAVSGTMAIGAELDPLPLMLKLAGAGAQLCLPVMAGKDRPLQFRAWAPGGLLVERIWGIQEPPATSPAVVPDILLVPLLAFDARGFRLGYGGGYYDRTLAVLRADAKVLAIGLGYEAQMVDAVPHGANDQRLDWILTEAGPRKAID